MDLMWINGKAILHIVDTATRFSAACFLDSAGMDYGQSVDGVWTAFIQTWCTIYSGFPNRIRTDQGSVFTSQRWRELTDMSGIELRLSGVKAHRSLGIGERLHGPLRRIYNKIAMDYPSSSASILLKIAVKAMNDTIGENGLVPSKLVFGITPRFPIISTDLPNQRNRMAALARAQMEMNSIVSERRVQSALTKEIPPAANRTYQLGERVLVFSELSKCWEGPYTVIHVLGRMVTVSSIDGSYRQTFNAFQMKPYYEAAIHYTLSNISMFQSGTERPAEMLLTEVIEPQDERTSLFGPAKEKEISGLIERKTWKVVDKSSLPREPNILGSRFVLAIKDEGTKRETWKARLIVQGYSDRLKNSLVHDIPNVRPRSLRLTLSLSAILKFRIFSSDVSQAYLQSDEPLDRDFYIRPTPDFNLPPNKLLKLVKPLYGIAEGGDYWGRTFRKHLIRDIEMVPTTCDEALFYKRNGDILIGTCATFVDDSIHGGNPEYCKATEETEKKFRCRPREFDNLAFSGMEVYTRKNYFEIVQTNYISKLCKLPKVCSFKEYSSLRAKLLWLTQTRPDITCAIAIATQVTEERFNLAQKEKIKDLNAAVSHIQKTKKLSLKFPELDRASLQMRVYTDASFASNYDLSSQLGYLVFLADKNNLAHLISWSSHKSKRVSRSVHGSEVMAFADGFDMAFAIRHDLQLMLSQSINILMFTDSLSLFDVLTKATVTTEKRLMIDLKTVKDSYKCQEIENICHVRSEFNPADALTKVKRNLLLEQFLETNKLDHPVEQWVIRKEVD